MPDRHYLSTTQCAHVIGMTAEFIRGEIKDQRLTAEVIPRACLPGRKWGRSIIRIYPGDFVTYLAHYWPRVQWHMPPAA